MFLINLENSQTLPFLFFQFPLPPCLLFSSSLSLFLFLIQNRISIKCMLEFLILSSIFSLFSYLLSFYSAFEVISSDVIFQA